MILKLVLGHISRTQGPPAEMIDAPHRVEQQRCGRGKLRVEHGRRHCGESRSDQEHARMQARDRASTPGSLGELGQKEAGRGRFEVVLTYRAPMNVPTKCDAVSRAIAVHIIVAPKVTFARVRSEASMSRENRYVARHRRGAVKGTDAVSIDIGK